MNDASRQATLDKMTAQLQEWGARADVIKAKLAQGAADIRIDWHRQMETWGEKESVFKAKMEEIRSASADGLENLKSGAQGVWSEITALFASIEENKNESRK